MKYIDKLLSKLNTDRNTFATYVLTLISVYILFDRVTEFLLMGFTGISYSYWGPFKYTVALACPVFAFYFSFASKFVSGEKTKLKFVYLYAVILYIIGASMVVQWANKLGWLLLFAVPNYEIVIGEFMDLIRPAFTALTWYMPVCTFYPLFKWIYMKLNDTKDIKDSIKDYGGIDLSSKTEGTGAYTFEVAICKSKETGKIIKIPESRRYESTLIIGNSGSGKTTMMFEPMIARDLERKFFLLEASKELGFTALRAGIAYLNCPYNNDYINENFSLSMIAPANNKEKVFKAYFSKLTFFYNGADSVYKNLGLTYMAPDHESFDHIKDVANNFGFKYNIIDPNDPNSIGLNPFAFKDSIKTALMVSAIFKRMYTANLEGRNTAETVTSNINLVTQAVEALVLLLKETYPLKNENQLPTLEDLLHLINNFDLIEELLQIMKDSPTLSQKYAIQIDYIEKTFSKDAIGLENTSKSLQSIASQIETLLYYPGVKNILCNQYNNISFDNVLKNGELVFVCTRRGDLGSNIHKSFGLYILLLMQESVLSRPGTEKSRIPHFLYVDEFPPFASKACEDIFTLYRKYHVGAIISAQNLGQFGDEKNSFRQTLLANCTNKIAFGNNTPEDNDWWRQEFGIKRDWKWLSDYKTADGQYSPDFKNIEYYWKDSVRAGQIQALPFKTVYFKTKDIRGKNIVGKASVDFLESKYKEKQKSKKYNFTKFTKGINTTEHTEKKKKSILQTHSNTDTEFDPIGTESSGLSNYKFDGDFDPITNFKKNS